MHEKFFRSLRLSRNSRVGSSSVGAEESGDWAGWRRSRYIPIHSSFKIPSCSFARCFYFVELPCAIAKLLASRVNVLAFQLASSSWTFCRRLSIPTDSELWCSFICDSARPSRLSMTPQHDRVEKSIIIAYLKCLCDGGRFGIEINEFRWKSFP